MRVMCDGWGAYVLYLTDIEPPEYYEPLLMTAGGQMLSVYWYDISTHCMWYRAVAMWSKLPVSDYDYGRVFSRQLEEFRELYVRPLYV
jgi:hypothetical protein